VVDVAPSTVVVKVPIVVERLEVVDAVVVGEVVPLSPERRRAIRALTISQGESAARLPSIRKRRPKLGSPL
jgi:hypothetical protein